MDVALLSTMLSELILTHDRVGLPGLGTFVAEVVPATFSDKGYTINPPYRRLSFYPSRSEDAVLVDLYAASNGISKEAASRYVGDFLSDLKTVLEEKKLVVLPGLGRLRATVENNFFFVPDEDLDIFPDGFALPPVSLKTIASPEADELSINPPLVRAQETAAPAQESLSPQFPETIGHPSESEEALEDSLQQQPEPSSEAIGQPSGTEEYAHESQERPAEGQPAESAEEQPAEAAEIPEENQAEATPSQAAEAVTETAVEQERPAEAQPAKSSGGRKVLAVLLSLLALAVILFASFVIISRVAPDIVDSILYSPEELRIINY